MRTRSWLRAAILVCGIALIHLADHASATNIVARFTEDDVTNKELRGNATGRALIVDIAGNAPEKRLTFDGHGYVEIDNCQATLNFEDSFTIEFDVTFDTLDGNPYLISKRSKSPEDLASGYWIEFKEGRWLDFTAAGGIARAQFVPQPGTSYHVVAVHLARDGGKGENLLYIDSIQRGSAECGARAPANDSPVTLGDYVGLYHAFKGALKGVHFSAVAKLPAQAQQAPSDPLPANVIGERDTLSNLIGDVQSMFNERELHDAGADSAFADLRRQLDDPALTLERIESLRLQLGQFVGGVAARQFPGQDFLVWQRPRWSDIHPHEWPRSDDLPPKQLLVRMARQSYASSAIVVTNTRDVASDIELLIQAPDNAPRIQPRRAWQIACPDLRYRPDPLTLISDGRLVLLPGETTFLWFEIASGDAPPGRYLMPVTLQSRNTRANLTLQIDVADAVLPSVLDGTLFNFSYLHEMGWIRDYQSAAIADLGKHFINTHIIDVEPSGRADHEGNLVAPIDFSGVDRKLELYKPHARLIGFFLKGDAHRHLPHFPELEFLGDPWKKAVTSWYKHFLSHLEQIGLRSDQYFMYVYDERSSPEVQQIYAMLKQAAPDVRLLLNPTTGYKPDELRQIAPYVDIWMPSYEALVHPHPEDFEFLKSTGAELWTYSCANGTSMPTYDYNLRRHWVAWDLGISGILQWAYADRGGWKGTNSWEFVIGAFAMVYAQPHAPKALNLTETLTPSRRWEAWREGSQDYQLLNMARKQAANSSADQARLKQAVQLVVSESQDLDAADRARAILLNLIAQGDP